MACPALIGLSLRIVPGEPSSLPGRRAARGEGWGDAAGRPWDTGLARVSGEETSADARRPTTGDGGVDVLWRLHATAVAQNDVIGREGREMEHDMKGGSRERHGVADGPGGGADERLDG